MNNINKFLNSISHTPITLHTILLPLGISFFIFQAISYLVDVHRNDISAQKNFVDLALYISLFPQLVAGPIVRYPHIAKQLENRTVSVNNFFSGGQRFVLGLGKKVLLADKISVPVNTIFLLKPEELSTPLAWMGAIGFTLQIYYDFSGYSDMAIGLGRMLGFNIPENFNYPYISTSITEFWKRWHISLSTWLRDYLYIPLGGSRGSRVMTYRNLFIVFILCGLWHGAAWRYVVFGIIHGVFIVIEKSKIIRLPFLKTFLLHHIYMLFVLIFSFIVFRSVDFDHTIIFLKAFVGQGLHTSPHLYRHFLTKEIVLIFLFATLFSAPLFPFVRTTLAQRMSISIKQISSIIYIVIVLAIFAASIASISAISDNPFIYFRF